MVRRCALVPMRQDEGKRVQYAAPTFRRQGTWGHTLYNLVKASHIRNGQAYMQIKLSLCWPWPGCICKYMYVALLWNHMRTAVQVLHLTTRQYVTWVTRPMQGLRAGHHESPIQGAEHAAENVVT